MPTAIALRSFEHGRRFSKGDNVTFDRLTIDALRKARLVGEDIHVDPKPQAVLVVAQPQAEDDGGKLPALPAAPALPPLTPPPLDAGAQPQKTAK